MIKNKRIASIIMLLALVLTIGGELFLAFSVRASAAETVRHSNVLDDLSKDEKFNPEDYPAKADDYSLKVIQIAEGANGELFVYVYQPSAETKSIIASSINISVEINQTNIINYDLELIDINGVFQKYKVKDFKVSAVVLRYYFISSIFRKYDAIIDNKPVDDNIIEQISCGVGQFWTATTVDNSPVYLMTYLDLITVLNEHRGFIRYMDLKLFQSYSYTDSHYIAFSTDKPIDNLLKAELSFWHKDYYIEDHSSLFHFGYESDNTDSVLPVPVHLTLDKEEVFSKNSWFHDDYEYNRIQTTDEFLTKETEEFTESTKLALSNTDWVLRFYESGYSNIVNSNCGTDTNPCISTVKQYSDVGGITILRLEYEYDGEIYNLGVVDSIGSGDSNPDNKDWDKYEEQEWWQKIMAALMIIIVIVALTFLSGPLGFVFKLLWTGLKFLFSIVLWVFKLPFKIIGWLLKGK